MKANEIYREIKALEFDLVEAKDFKERMLYRFLIVICWLLYGILLK